MILGGNGWFLFGMTEITRIYNIREYNGVLLGKYLIMVPVKLESDCEMTRYFLGKAVALFPSHEPVSELAQELVNPQSD